MMFSSNSIAKKFAFEKFMRGGIKGFFKVQYKGVNLTLVISDFCPIIYHRDKLSFTTMPFPECMLFF